MSNVIEYGISLDYLPNWTVSDALREIYQNFIDYGEFNIETKKIKDTKHILVTLSNNYNPKDCSFLQIGSSGKREDESSIGGHGEGLKLAMMVMKRNHYLITVRYNTTVLKPTIYISEKLGNAKCFGIDYDCGMSPVDEFIVEFMINETEYEAFKDSVITDADKIFSCYYGSIVNKPVGNIYVGGLFVTNIPKLKYAYDFSPSSVPLDRDRKIPAAFDVQWAASNILQCRGAVTIDDFNGDDCNYISKIPDNVAKEFIPKLDSSKNVVFVADTVIAPSSLTSQLSNMPANKKRIKKLSYKMITKRKPLNILKDFRDNHHFSGSTKIELDAIIDKAKDWC